MWKNVIKQSGLEDLLVRICIYRELDLLVRICIYRELDLLVKMVLLSTGTWTYW